MLTAFHNRSFSELWCSYESHPHDAPHCELELTWVRTEDSALGRGVRGGADPSDGRGGQVPLVFISTSLRPVDDRLRQTLEVVTCEICRARRKARESHGNRISEPVAPATVAHRFVI